MIEHDATVRARRCKAAVAVGKEQDREATPTMLAAAVCQMPSVPAPELLREQGVAQHHLVNEHDTSALAEAIQEQGWPAESAA